ncbi:MAG TPA: reductive dehalogenase domain-containing protein [Anaerolineales bacterium]|nr:reductive dehalogenase domain-containing protein [Anaerolineales bacterium]
MLTENTLNTIFVLLSILNGLVWGWFALDSRREGKARAVKISLLLAGGSINLFLAIYLTLFIKTVIFFTILGFGLLFIVLFFLPIGVIPPDTTLPTRRVDERTIMFARHRLKPGTPEYETYYRDHPEHLAVDERTRARPGLFSPDSKYPDPLAYAAADTSFKITEALHPMVEGEPAPDQHPLTPQAAARYIKGMAEHFGAVEVGITELQPYQVYSHIGRGPGEYGAPVELNHQFAIAFTVEMDYDLVAAAPTGPVSVESAHQYVEAGKISVQLADAIRSLGYPARAHMDANYRVVCPPVARDAGLGEIGRISLLMSPKMGPRVRLGVVTTDLPLVVDPPSRDPAVIDFCTICQKCATNCPSNSIPFGERTMEDGVLRWKLNDETCFAYWNQIGTDCAICMAVCPFSHPDTPLHNLVRWGIARSGFFRRAALQMDDLLYGKYPQKGRRPDWL